MNVWEVWFVGFPYEEDSNIIRNRPVIVINIEPLEVLSVKVTSHDLRDWDNYDVPISHWKECGLDRPSVARVAKTMYLSKENFSRRVGNLHTDDQVSISEKYIEFINNK